MKSRRNWTQKEDQIFRKVVNQSKSLNWAQIAKRLSNEYGFKKRTGKQCRQRWFNHLMPGISKKIWNKAQEENLLNLHKRFGNKWTIISQHLPGRTDNSIKNYFYSTIRRSLRRMGKIIGSKNSTSLLRQIKPSTLTRIFSTKNDEQILNFQTFQSQCQKCQIYNLSDLFQKIRDQIIQFSTFKPKIHYEISQQERERYKQVFDLIAKLNRINEYTKQQQKAKKTKEQIFKNDFKLMMNQQSQEDEEEDNLQSFQIQQSQNDRQIQSDQRNIDKKVKQIKIQDLKCRDRMQQKLKMDVDHNRIIQKIKEKEVKQLKKKEVSLILVQNESNQNQKPQVMEQYNQDPIFSIEMPQEDSYEFSKYLNYNINASPSLNRYHHINFFVSPMAHKNPFIKNLYQQLNMGVQKQQNKLKGSKHVQQAEQQN